MKRQLLALHDQHDVTPFESIRQHRQSSSPPTEEIFVFSFQAQLPRTGVVSRELKGGAWRMAVGCSALQSSRFLSCDR